MRSDPIVEEIRKYRQAHAKKFNYNLEAIVADLRRQETEAGSFRITGGSPSRKKKSKAKP